MVNNSKIANNNNIKFINLIIIIIITLAFLNIIIIINKDFYYL